MLLTPQFSRAFNAELAGRFLRSLGHPPFQIISGGARRAFGERAFDKLAGWATQNQNLGRPLFVAVPEIGGAYWYLAADAPLDARPSELEHLPSITVAAERLFMLWRLAEPVGLAKAHEMSAEVARRIGGRSFIGRPLPLPGTMRKVEVRRNFAQNFQVRLAPASGGEYQVEGSRLFRLASGGERQGADAGPRFDLASEVTAEAIDWLWPGAIPAGDLTIIMGEPKIGKSQIAVDISARVSSGRDWPTGERGKRGGVILLEQEDDLKTVIKPRLEAAGADMRRVMVHGVIDLAVELGALRSEAKRLGGVRLVVLSPMRMFFGETEAHGQIETRKRIEPLLDWARAEGVAVVGIAHKEVGKGGRSAEDVAGPKAYAQRARAVFTAMADPSDPMFKTDPKKARRIFVAGGTNASADDFALPYRIEGAKVGAVETSRIIWEGEST